MRLGLTLAALLGVSGTAHSALIDRGPDMFFDDVAGLTYLRAPAVGGMFDDGAFSDDGRLSFRSAGAWAEALEVRTETGALITDWRLLLRGEPAYAGTSPFAWYGDIYTPTAADIAANAILTFEGWIVREPEHIWPPAFAWTTAGFGLDTLTLFDGRQFKNYGMAFAVRTGDVALVPEPASAVLLLAGLALATALARARRPA